MLSIKVKKFKKKIVAYAFFRPIRLTGSLNAVDEKQENGLKATGLPFRLWRTLWVGVSGRDRFFNSHRWRWRENFLLTLLVRIGILFTNR